jgi:predicted dehydrogenase
VWRIAVVGTGRMGRRHLSAWAALAPRAAVVAVVDRSSFASLPRVLPGCDVLDVCLPTPLHADVTVAALTAGRSVLVEKPIALTLGDADRMLAAAATSPGHLMIAHVVRFFPAYRRLLALPSSLGAPLGAHAYRFTGGDPALSWLADPARSGGALVDLLVHDYDLLNALLGAPLRVAAQEDPGGAASVLIGYPGGRAGSAVGNMSLPPAYPFRAGATVTFEGGVADVLPAGTLRVVDTAGGVTEVAPSAVDPYVEQARHLIDCLDTGVGPEHGTGDQARAALALALAARQSAATGTAVHLPP